MADFEAVLKAGGSLSCCGALAGLGPVLAGLARRFRLLVVPGGGEFADLVRAQDRTYHLGETIAHRMALLAMDQYGYLLAGVLPGAVVTNDLVQARRLAAAGKLPVFLPAGLLLQVDPLPNSWQVTSDSLGAWIAGQVAAPRFVLLKDVDGLYAARPEKGAASGGLHRELSLTQLAHHHGGIDEYLATVLAGLDLETWVINGRHPERLAALLETGSTVGTLIGRR